MASVVRSKQTPGAATSSLSITAPKAKNVLAAFVMQNSTLLAPSSTGWTFSPTKAEQGAGANSLWFGTKEATGLEVAIAPTPGAGGSIAGISYFELEGSSQEIESIIGISNSGAATTQTSNALATSKSTDIILACIGLGATNGGSSAWSGTGPMTNVEAGETRAQGGYFVPSSTLSAATFTANWSSSRTHGMLVVALKAAATAAKVVVGNPVTTQTIAEAIGAGTVFAWQFAAKESSLMERLELFIGTGSGSTSVELGIYEDVAGEPGALLGHGLFTRVPEKGTWIMAPLASAVALVSGTNYWLSFLPLGGSLVINLSTTEGGTDRELNGAPHAKLEAGTWSGTHTLNLGFVGIGTSTGESFSGALFGSLGIIANLQGVKRVSAAVSQVVGFAQQITGTKAASGSLTQSLRTAILLTGSKRTSSALAQAVGIKGTTTGSKRVSAQLAATVGVQPQFAGSKLSGAALSATTGVRVQLAGAKRVSAIVVQSTGLLGSLLGSKRSSSGIVVAAGLRPALLGAKRSSGSVSQSAGVSATLIGNKAGGSEVHEGAVLLSVGVIGTVTGRKVGTGPLSASSGAVAAAAGKKRVQAGIAASIGFRPSLSARKRALGSMTVALGIVAFITNEEQPPSALIGVAGAGRARVRPLAAAVESRLTVYAGPRQSRAALYAGAGRSRT